MKGYDCFTGGNCRKFDRRQSIPACDCIVKERPKIIENIDFLCAEEKMSLLVSILY
jgi:hypothetical protein